MFVGSSMSQIAKRMSRSSPHEVARATSPFGKDPTSREAGNQTLPLPSVMPRRAFVLRGAKVFRFVSPYECVRRARLLTQRLHGRLPGVLVRFPNTYLRHRYVTSSWRKDMPRHAPTSLICLVMHASRE